MRLSQRNRNQTATRWVSGDLDIYGNATWTSSNIKVRWEDKQEKAVDINGNDIVSNSIVYVGEDLNIGDYLMLGTSAEASPPEGSYRVRNFSKIPNLAATDFIRKVIL